MKLSTIDVAHILIALATLMAAAHLVGSLFASMRQPKVIGEIVGGILLGPTVLGALAPDVAAWLFPKPGQRRSSSGPSLSWGSCSCCSAPGARSGRRSAEGRASPSPGSHDGRGPALPGRAGVPGA